MCHLDNTTNAGYKRDSDLHSRLGERLVITFNSAKILLGRNRLPLISVGYKLPLQVG